MKIQPLISTVDTLALLECLRDHGVADIDVKKATGVDSELLKTPDFAIPLQNLIKLWQLTEEVTGDPAIGIHLRKRYGQHYLHFVNHIGINSQNVREALLQYNRYGKLFCKSFSYDLREEKGVFVFSFDIISPHHQNPWIPEYHLSLILHIAKMLGIDELLLKEVRFKHACRSKVDPYEAFFGAPTYFNQTENALYLSEKTMQMNIPGYDAHLQTVLKKQADEILALLPRENPFLTRVERIIIENLESGMLTIETVARELSMHRSTLHRKFKENGTSFGAFLTELRKNLSELYLAQGQTTEEIAYRLGYSSRSNFQVAFKSWFGISPGSFHKSRNPAD